MIPSGSFCHVSAPFSYCYIIEQENHLSHCLKLLYHFLDTTNGGFFMSISVLLIYITMFVSIKGGIAPRLLCNGQKIVRNIGQNNVRGDRWQQPDHR